MAKKTPVTGSSPAPKARSRKAKADQAASRAAQRKGDAPVHVGSPRWLVPTALTLLIVGVLYMVVYYITNATLPLPIGDWNLAVGLGIILTGGALLTGWK